MIPDNEYTNPTTKVAYPDNRGNLLWVWFEAGKDVPYVEFERTDGQSPKWTVYTPTEACLEVTIPPKRWTDRKFQFASTMFGLGVLVASIFYLLM